MVFEFIPESLIISFNWDIMNVVSVKLEDFWFLLKYANVNWDEAAVVVGVVIVVVVTGKLVSYVV